MRKFVFGSFVYEYALVEQERSTLSLTVMPDLSIVLKCPIGADIERIESFLKKKWFWLEKQINFFKKYQRKTYKKECVTGESYLYLGRQYKLVVNKADDDRIVLDKGKLVVNSSNKKLSGVYTKHLLSIWFRQRTRSIFEDRYSEIIKLFDYKTTPKLEIKEMAKRWGSYTAKNKLVLNPKLIHAPKYCIDYVLAHELCHVKYKNHDKRFYKLLEEKYPKWEKTKERLENIGIFVY